MFRNAPRSGGISPAQLVLNRPVRDSVPAHRRSFAPEWQIAADAIEKRARRSNELQIKNYNKKAHPLPPFTVGNHVLIQHPISKLWKTTGVIVEVGPHRDYLVETLAGRIYRRSSFPNRFQSNIPFRYARTKIQPNHSRYHHRSSQIQDNNQLAVQRGPDIPDGIISLMIGLSNEFIALACIFCFNAVVSHVEAKNHAMRLFCSLKGACDEVHVSITCTTPPKYKI